MRVHTKLFVGLLSLLLLLIAARAALPYVVKDFLNGRLAAMGQYRGHIEDVDLHLWRGAYSINQLIIEKTSGKVPVPLLQTPNLDLSVSWREIFHGAVVAEVIIDRPQLNLVDGRSEADSQTGRGVDWRKQLDQLLPIKLNSVRVNEGTLSFRNFVSSPPVDLKATQVNATILNLTNVRGAGGKRVARLDASARVLGQAPLEATASFDPFGTLDEFAFDLRVLEIELLRLNPFLQAYANLDVASGKGDFVMQLEAADGRLKGYAKPLFQDVKMLSWEQDVKQQRDNPLRLAWEALSGGVIALLKNQGADQFATRIEISGSLNDPKTGKLDALLAILRNAFVEAFKPQFEQAQ